MLAASEMDEALGVALEDFVDLLEYWNGGNGAAVDACQHTLEISEQATHRIGAVLQRINANPETVQRLQSQGSAEYVPNDADEGSSLPPKYDTPEPRQIEGGEIPQVEHPVDLLAERIRDEHYHTRIDFLPRGCDTALRSGCPQHSRTRKRGYAPRCHEVRTETGSGLDSSE